MPALNFQKQFAPLVESGAKCQTIRAYRKRPFKVGDKLYLYTGMKTKSCRKLGEATCSEIRRFTIDGDLTSLRQTVEIEIDNLHADAFEVAKADGFKDEIEMASWFGAIYGLPFTGQLIKWDPEHGAGGEG